MIVSIYYSSPQSPPQFNLSLDELRGAAENLDGLLWISLEQPSLEESNHILRDGFKFHPLAIEDCQSTGYQTPKIDDFNEYVFFIAHALPSNPALISTENSMELNIFLGTNYLVTSYNCAEMPPVQDIHKRLEKDERLYQNGPDFLCYAIMDHLVDHYMPLLDELDVRLELLEDRVLEKPTPEILSELIEQKHILMALRRIISPQREVINRLSRDDFPMIDPQSRIYYRDIYDHLVRIQDLSESLRDIVSGVMDIYLNSTSLRLNEVMKALTIVSTIFLPMSFVAGVYGMNFHFMPELSWRFGYPLIWVVFIAIFVGMVAYFKKRNWF